MTQSRLDTSTPVTAVAPSRRRDDGPWVLIWRRFRRNRLAVVGGIVVVLLYLVALLAEFVAPYDDARLFRNFGYAPPQALGISWVDDAGNRQWGLHVRSYDTELDLDTMKRSFVPGSGDDSIVPVTFFAEAKPYLLAGLIPMRHHLIGPVDDRQPMFLLGSDRLGRDVLSRLIYGTRISLSIGLIGVSISLFLGILLGGLSGYLGGWWDTAIQRSIEFIRSIPTIPLFLGLAAAVPATWSPLLVYFILTLILAIVGWTELARVVRGRFMAMRSEDFVLSAKLDGGTDIGIILRHMAPSFASHIIAAATLAVPGMILAETALSFLGLGLRPPFVSWGVLMQEAQNIRSIATAPWLFASGVVTVIAILAMNFLGDGLRDAADPYK
ncbi:ABC transporter permease [Devosia sp. LjRoot16]|uniref:ABC transporter permease n=1 Tax=Devosia sp. LjRoot16 TaxID=3342271 RepID=UPI003ECE76A8